MPLHNAKYQLPNKKPPRSQIGSALPKSYGGSGHLKNCAITSVETSTKDSQLKSPFLRILLCDLSAFSGFFKKSIGYRYYLRQVDKNMFNFIQFTNYHQFFHIFFLFVV